MNIDKKRKAREFCFQYFFHLQLPMFKELHSEIIRENRERLEESMQDFALSADYSLENENKDFLSQLIFNCLKQYENTLTLINKYLKNWKFERLAKVDQTILLLSFTELSNSEKNLQKVVINEAIELAKKYGTAESAKFINGVLDNYYKSEIHECK